jgi:3-hydroxypropanoate dehydrogenase
MTVDTLHAAIPTSTSGRLPRLDETGMAALFTAARTASSFTAEPVSDEVLRDIWQLAKWPPTAANMQPLRVVYVRPGSGRERLVPLLNEGNRGKAQAAPAVAILAYDKNFHEHVPTVLPFRPELREVFAADETARLATAERNAWLQAGYFILAVRAHGLAAGPMGGFDARAVDGEFFPSGRFASFLVVNIGHPGAGAWLDRLPRLDEETVLSWA